MKKKQLEILLQKVRGFPSPSSSLEQYSTPPPIAAELLFFALMNGDLDDTVYDLGCGTGILAIGAGLLGAEKIVGFDIDTNALKIARHNASTCDVEIEFVCTRIQDVSGEAHTVLMNPPFGAQNKGNDRPFLKKAVELADVVYSIHNAGSRTFIKKFINPAVITDCYHLGFPIERTFKFHKKDKAIVNVEIYRIENNSRHNNHCFWEESGH